MATYFVQQVVRNPSSDGRHNHIVAVFSNGVRFTNAEVHDSLRRGDSWYTDVPNYPHAKIITTTYCPRPACMFTPFLTTEPDSTSKNNLENLP